MVELRPYQEEAIEAVFKYWREEGGNPLVELATGLGKSLVVAEVARRLLRDFPAMRIIMVVHVRELVQQNFQELLRLWPDAPVGIYSAGLGQRDTHHRIIYASIQSVFKKADIFSPRHLMLIDEAHLVPADGEGMYRTFIDNLRVHYPGLRIMGLTATPYRLDSGRLDQGAGRLFDRIVHAYGIGPGTEAGFLSPLTARSGSVEISVDGVEKRGGEFVPSALNHAANKADIVAAACDDIVARGQDRKSWLAFCSGIDHAHAVAAALRDRGVTCETVTGNTPKDERDRIISDFKAGKIRALTNAQVLTTGFNAPGVDLIALMRPTLSTGLYVQMMGRGTRLSPGKENCLVLDYAGNVRRHGPVDAIHVRDKQKRGEAQEGKVDVSEVRAKECPDCQAIVFIAARTCPDCGHEFGEPKHDTKADDVAVMTRDLRDLWIPVSSWRARAWQKAGDPDAPPTMRVDTLAGVSEVSEWLAFEHTGFARQKAAQWWVQHGGGLPVPASIDEALVRFEALKPPSAITLARDGKYTRIDKRRFEQVQA